MNSKTAIKIEKQINARLASMAPERRPETSYRRRIQSVAYLTREMFEATDLNGNVETVSMETAKGW